MAARLRGDRHFDLFQSVRCQHALGGVHAFASWLATKRLAADDVEPVPYMAE